MNRKKKHEKCIRILDMIDTYTARIWRLKEKIIEEKYKPITEAWLFSTKERAEVRVVFMEKCLSRLFSYYAKNAIKTIQ